MPPRNLLPGLVSGLLFTGVLTVGFSIYLDRGMERQFPLRVLESDLDMGKVWVQDDYRHTLRVFNDSDHPITIDGFHTSCHCTSVDADLLTIPPGDFRSVDVSLDLLKYARDSEVDDTRIELRLIPAAQVYPPSSWPVWTLIGEFVWPLRVSPARLHFAEPISYGVEPPPGNLFVECESPYNQIDVQCDYAHGCVTAVDVAPATDSLGLPHFQLNIRLRDDLPVGRFESQVLLFGAAPSHGRAPPIPLVVSGEVTADIEWDPKRLLLASQGRGSSDTRRVSVWTKSGAALTVTPLGTVAPGTVVTLLPDQGHNGLVVFDIRPAIATGVNATEFSFLAEGPSLPRPLTVSIPVIYDGGHDE